MHRPVAAARLRGGRRIAAACVSVAFAGCSSGPSPQPSASAPVVTPTGAYAPFHYANDEQRATFHAFLSCASRHGVRYQGPFSDSSGTGIFIRVSPGEHPTRAERDEVSSECPELEVATFGTPVGGMRQGAFEHAATAFAACVRRHGIPAFPDPAFSGASAVQAFWRLPFPWSSSSFVRSVTSCIDPLRNYIFAGQT
jgi:hypothetical protein